MKATGVLSAAYWLGPNLMSRGRAHAGERLFEALPGCTLDPFAIPKYQMPLVIPPAMPPTSEIKTRDGQIVDYYEIAVQEFQQRILPPGLPMTTVWSYGSINHPGTFNYPAFTIEAKWQKPVRVKWKNGLVDGNGEFLPHLLPVDPTLHWANPPGGEAGRDMPPTFEGTPGPYEGPVAFVTHLHGAAGVGDESDGYAEAWYLPAASNIPSGFARVGTWYKTFKAQFLAERMAGHPSDVWEAGTATFQYPNTHRAATLWYHDHTLGMTRVNVYAGPAGFYILRGGPDDKVFDIVTKAPAVLPGPAPALGDPPGVEYFEIPIVVQDRSFHADGSLFYPDSRAFFDGITQYIPETDVSPIWNPEFFGDTIVVNGRTWPFLNVERRRYRFRFLNGSNSRFLILKLDRPGLKFWQIGTEGGFLPAPVQVSELLLGPAERADVIVDFTHVPVGTEILLLNLGPDEPFGGGVPGKDFPPSNPATTGQVMQFRVVAATSEDKSTRPNHLLLPAIKPLTGGETRPLALLEMTSAFFEEAPIMAMLGTFDPSTGVATPEGWGDPITENPAVGATEVWALYNLTMDAHPIHIHEVTFQVVNRQALDMDTNLPIGRPAPPEVWETGFKDTVIAYPGEVTRVRARFDTPGLFVWHCHIVEHEDNEMMRSYAIGKPPTPIP